MFLFKNFFILWVLQKHYICTMFRKYYFSLYGILTGLACTPDAVPKPKGELRLEYPKAHYQNFQSPCHYGFQYSDFAKITPAKQNSCWYNLSYPQMRANVFLTYFPIKNDFLLHIKEAEKMVYEHTIKASAIETKSFSFPEKKVYGNFYELKGESASNIQFFITDSTQHFVTGNLYFNTRPKPDSLSPAVDYIKQDLLHLIETFQWTN